MILLVGEGRFRSSSNCVGVGRGRRSYPVDNDIGRSVVRLVITRVPERRGKVCKSGYREIGREDETRGRGDVGVWCSVVHSAGQCRDDVSVDEVRSARLSKQTLSGRDEPRIDKMQRRRFPCFLFPPSSSGSVYFYLSPGHFHPHPLFARRFGTELRTGERQGRANGDEKGGVTCLARRGHHSDDVGIGW